MISQNFLKNLWKKFWDMKKYKIESLEEIIGGAI